MSLQIHRAERADRLVDALGELLSTPLPDPFATEIVSVPTPGVERWLAQRLSRRLGASPGRNRRHLCRRGLLLAEAAGRPRRGRGAGPGTRTGPVAAGAGGLAAAAGDRRLPGRGLGVPAVELPRRPEGATTAPTPVRGGRRWSTARHLADLFAAYAVRRPAMVTAWAEGRDVDGADRPLPPDRAWQAELWRRLATELGGPHPPEQVRRWPRRCAPIQAGPACPNDCRSSASPGSTPTIARCSTRWPCTGTSISGWPIRPRSSGEQLAAAASDTLPLRAHDQSEQCVHHPLLAYLGRDVRELQLGLRAPSLPRSSTSTTPPHQLRARRPPPCCRDCRPTSPPMPSPVPRPTARCSTPTTAACRCTPATARTARSRCCAKCWSGCSPTTPPCSRGTSS